MGAFMSLQYMLGKPGAGVTAGTSQWFPIQGDDPSALLITFTGLGTITAGTVLIEETDDPNDGLGAAGSQLATQDLTQVSAGKKLCVHIGPGAYSFIRARLSAAVTGGGTAIVSLAVAGV